jgi:hypothetical protein
MKEGLLSMKANLPEINFRHAWQFPSCWPACLPDILSIRQQQQGAIIQKSISGRL